MVLCPRCGINPLNPKPVRNALSREDNITQVCSMCGTDEAMRDYARESLWPGYPNTMTPREVKKQ